MATFAEQLAAARKAAGMTQEDLADAVHVARSTVSSWEKGRTQPDLDTMRQLMKTLQFDFLNGEAIPLATAEAELTTNAEAAGTEIVPTRKPGKKKIIALCALALVVIAVSAVMLISHNAKISKTASLNLTALHNPAPMIADPAFEDYGLGWDFTFVITNDSDVPFRPQKAIMLYYKDDSIAGNMELDYAFLRGCMYGDTITNTDPAPVHINWGASYPLFTGVELQLHGTDNNGHEIRLSTTVELSQEKPPEPTQQ